MVFPQVQPIKNVSMPGLQVDGERALALSPSLIHIPVAIGYVEWTAHSSQVGLKAGAKNLLHMAQEEELWRFDIPPLKVKYPRFDIDDRYTHMAHQG